MAATTLANRVAEEMGSSLGQLVGYSVRLDECFDRQKTKIKFMTEGILVIISLFLILSCFCFLNVSQLCIFTVAKSQCYILQLNLTFNLETSTYYSSNATCACVSHHFPPL